MGIISLERVDNLIWLGRYSERVYLTIKEFFRCYDEMLDHPTMYQEYCQNLQIPMIYESPTDFVQRYVRDEDITDSIIANLYRAYDNCIVLRNEIGTETMTYLELALDDLKSIHEFDSFLLDLQLVVDHILAFWASLSENVLDYDVRDIIKLGQRQERMDMYLRLRKEKKDIKKAYDSLHHRLNKTILPYDLLKMEQLKTGVEETIIDYPACIECVEGLL
ncbi:MAG: alpha-E domain-containing protein [Firmicutes bacterium]|nr:alpha-E domain-containing protein [Bacillota bacterium]